MAVCTEQDQHRFLWDRHLWRWRNHMVTNLFPTYKGELNAKECTDAMSMYQDDYAVFCAIERMTVRNNPQPIVMTDEERRW